MKKLKCFCLAGIVSVISGCSSFPDNGKDGFPGEFAIWGLPTMQEYQGEVIIYTAFEKKDDGTFLVKAAGKDMFSAKDILDAVKIRVKYECNNSFNFGAYSEEIVKDDKPKPNTNEQNVRMRQVTTSFSCVL